MTQAIKTCGNCKREFSTEDDFLRSTTRWRQCESQNLWVNCACGSTLMIPKGKYDWYSPDKQMSDKAGSVFNKLVKDSSFPHMDAQVFRIQELLSSEEFKLEDLVSAIKSDPLMATDVLAVANRMKVSGTDQIDSIKHAVVYIGREALREIVLLAGIRKIEIDTTTFIIEDFWEESMNAGIAAEMFCRRFVKNLNPDEVYLSACLANIGKLLMAMLLPNSADKVAEGIYGSETVQNWAAVEIEYELPQHSILGEVASVLWGFPEYVRDSASRHHGVDELFSKKDISKMSLVDVVALSVQISHLIQAEKEVVQKDIIEKFTKTYGVSPKNFNAFVREIRNAIQNKQEKAA
ncbi:HDOD domain-containing protein [Oligoflexaceae bacterium]|nr:HDOD domain-containing protein [Oligoflexaceae bacterium]